MDENSSNPQPTPNPQPPNPNPQPTVIAPQQTQPPITEAAVNLQQAQASLPQQPPQPPNTAATAQPVPPVAPSEPTPTLESPPTTPVAPQPTITTPPSPQITMSAQSVQPMTADTIPEAVVPKSKPKFKKLLLPIIAGMFLLLGGAAAAYNVFILNNPQNLWNRSLKTTSAGLEEIMNLAQEEPAKGGKLDGSFKVESPTVIDGTVKGEWYESSAKYEAEVGFSGIRPKAEVMIIPPNADTSPDIYAKISQIEGVQSLIGAYDPTTAELIGQVNNQWYKIDHTLYEQYLLNAGQDDENKTPELSAEEIKQIQEAVMQVLNERLFTDDSSVAVVVVDEAIGKEDFEGVETYKYRLKVQKEQLKQFATALKDALKGTKLNDLILSGSSAESLEKAINFDEMLKSIEEADLDAVTAEAWVDVDRKFIRNIRLTPNNLKDGDSGHLDFYLPYNGGDEFPFTMRFYSKEGGSDGESNISVVLNFNKSTKAVKFTFDVNAQESGQKIIGSGNFTVTPSDEALNLTPPEGSKDIYEFIGQYLGGISASQNYQFQPTLPIDDVEL